MDLFTGVADSQHGEIGQENGMGRPATGGESPVSENRSLSGWIQSTAGHVKPRGKPGGPPSKPKYELVTDSVEVHGGDKGSRTPDLLLARQALSQLSYAPMR